MLHHPSAAISPEPHQWQVPDEALVGWPAFGGELCVPCRLAGSKLGLSSHTHRLQIESSHASRILVEPPLFPPSHPHDDGKVAFCRVWRGCLIRQPARRHRVRAREPDFSSGAMRLTTAPWDKSFLSQDLAGAPQSPRLASSPEPCVCGIMYLGIHASWRLAQSRLSSFLGGK